MNTTEFNMNNSVTIHYIEDVLWNLLFKYVFIVY